MTRDGKWGELAGAVSDDVLELFVASGRHDQIKAVVERRFGGVSDALSVNANPLAPAGLGREVVAELASLPTPFRHWGE